MLAGSLAVAAAVAAGWGAGRWVVIHLALAGGGSVAISAAALHLAVTWSGAPAPPDWATHAQRWLLAMGVVAAVLGRSTGQDGVLLAGTAATALGFVTLAVLLASSTRSARQQRYRVQVWSYVVSAVFGGAGVAAGGLLATGHHVAPLHRAHPLVMVWGFVGIVVTATLPTFTATTLRMKPSPLLTPSRLAGVVAVHASGVALAAGGAASGRLELGATGLVLVATALVATVALLPRPTRRAFAYAGPRGVGIGTAAAWWIGTTAHAAVTLSSSGWPTGGRAVVVLLIGGVAQLLWAAIGYFAPVLRGGGPERLTEGFRIMRSWTALIALNLAAATASAGGGTPTGVLVAIAAADTTWRTARLLGPHTVPTP